MARREINNGNGSAQHDHAPDRPKAGASSFAVRYIRPVGRLARVAMLVIASTLPVSAAEEQPWYCDTTVVSSVEEILSRGVTPFIGSGETLFNIGVRARCRLDVSSDIGLINEFIASTGCDDDSQPVRSLRKQLGKAVSVSSDWNLTRPQYREQVCKAAALCVWSKSGHRNWPIATCPRIMFKTLMNESVRKMLNKAEPEDKSDP